MWTPVKEESIKTVKLVQTLHKDEDFTVKDILKKLNISRRTYYNYLKIDLNKI